MPQRQADALLCGLRPQTAGRSVRAQEPLQTRPAAAALGWPRSRTAGTHDAPSRDRQRFTSSSKTLIKPTTCWPWAGYMRPLLLRIAAARSARLANGALRRQGPGDAAAPGAAPPPGLRAGGPQPFAKTHWISLMPAAA